MELNVREHVPLAPYCTMGVGGAARWFTEAPDEAAVAAARAWARGRGVPLLVLGGGSNLVVADAGVHALVVRVAPRGVTTHARDGVVDVTAAAGEPWDDLVRDVVARGWAGLECLSGIPGLVGATPIQNVGAYGQEVAETVVAVRAFDVAGGRIVTLAPADCGFTYRDSAFKREPGRFIVLAVTYRVRPGGAPAVKYADIASALAAREVATPSLGDVRDTVLTVRRAKSMVIDSADPNRRSCGSFFTNPIVDASDVARIEQRVGDVAMPRWPQPDGRVKLSAAWLIERAGFTRGHRAGPVGLSTRHALAIVAHDGARASDVLAFAETLRKTVRERFGVTLTPEPVVWNA